VAQQASPVSQAGQKEGLPLHWRGEDLQGVIEVPDIHVSCEPYESCNSSQGHVGEPPNRLGDDGLRSYSPQAIGATVANDFRCEDDGTESALYSTAPEPGIKIYRGVYLYYDNEAAGLGGDNTVSPQSRSAAVIGGSLFPDALSSISAT
jgi:hypothetical protein